MKQFNFGNHYNEPVWRPARLLFDINIPEKLNNWLTNDSSLTQHLISRCHGRFQVQVLNQGWQRPMPNEARCLKMRHNSYAFVRHVHLLCNDIPVVFARTVIPPRTLSGAQRRLTKLGQKSLGAVLFADRSMRRMELEITRMDARQKLYNLATSHLPRTESNIWGRRSVFHLHNHPLLVCEIFLPTILQL